MGKGGREGGEIGGEGVGMKKFSIYSHLQLLIADVDCLSEVTLEKLKAFIPDLLGRLHIECLFHGNLTKEVSLNI